VRLWLAKSEFQLEGQCRGTVSAFSERFPQFIQVRNLPSATAYLEFRADDWAICPAPSLGAPLFVPKEIMNGLAPRSTIEKYAGNP
jgi:hypothetical protein